MVNPKEECIKSYDKQGYRILEIPINPDKPKALIRGGWNTEPTNLKIGKDNLYAVIQEDNKLVIDIDEPEFNFLLEEYLDKTLIIQTGNNGRHAYFKDQKRDEKYQIKISDLYYGDKHIGDIKAHMSYVVGCGGSYQEDGKTKTYTQISSVDQVLKTDVYEILKKFKEHGITTKKVNPKKEKTFEKGFKTGERNNECFKMACNLYKKPDSTFEFGLDFVKTFNLMQENPLDNSEIETLCKSAWKTVGDEKDEITLNHVKDFILSRYDFLTINDKNRELYVYQDGVYVIGGNSIIDIDIENNYPEDSTHRFRTEVLEKIKIHTLIEREELDKDDNILNLKNGLYNVEKGNLTPHLPTHKSIIQYEIVYDEKAKCSKIFKFLNEVILEEKERKTVLEMLAELFWKNSTLSKSYFLIGKGGNGKTILRDIILGLIGEQNVCNLEISDYADKYLPSELFGKIVNIPDEIDDTKVIKTAKWKSATANRSIQAQSKFGKPFTFIPYAKNIMPCNRPPELDDKSDGTYRRIVPIHFNQIFTHHLTPELKKMGVKQANDEFTKSLTEEKEISGMFNVLMKILPSLKHRQKLTHALTIEEIRDEWETLADTTKEWISDVLVEDIKGVALKTDYYNSFITFCKLKNYKTEGIKTFYAKFQRLGAIETRQRLHPKDKNTSYCFTGFWFRDKPKEPTKDKKQQIINQDNL